MSEAWLQHIIARWWRWPRKPFEVTYGPQRLCSKPVWSLRFLSFEKQDLPWRKFQMNSLHPISRRWWYLHEGGNATRWRRFLRKSVLPRHDVNVKRNQLAGLLLSSFKYCWVLLEHCWVLLRSFGPPFQLSPGQISKWSVWLWNLFLVWISWLQVTTLCV